MLTSPVCAYIDDHDMIPQGASVLAAVSGGPDSMALMVILHRLIPVYKMRLSVVHVDHQLRGRESQRDARFVRQHAARLGLSYHLIQIDAAGFRDTSGLSLQHAARELRYAALANLQQQIGADRIALGHIADDQTETLLLRLLRGTGPSGLAGIPPVRPPYIRPLMAVRRQTLVRFLQCEHMPWVQDSSNDKRIYQRNRIRHDILPMLRQHNPQIDQRLYELTDMMTAEHQLLERQVDDWYPSLVRQRTAHRLAIQCQRYQQAPLAIQRRLLRRLADRYVEPHAAVQFRHLEGIRHFLRDAQTGQRLTLPGQWLLEKHHHEALMWRPLGSAHSFRPISLSVPGQTRIPELDAMVTAEWLDTVPSTLAPDKDVVYIDAASIQMPLTVRARWPGARFHPLGAPGHKKLKAFLIDKKVPRAEREYIPLVVSGTEIVWVVGHQLGHRFRIHPETRQTIQLQYSTSNATRSTTRS